MNKLYRPFCEVPITENCPCHSAIVSKQHGLQMFQLDGGGLENKRVKKMDNRVGEKTLSSETVPRNLFDLRKESPKRN